MPRRILTSRAYQLAQEPESLVMIAWSGSRGDSSKATRWGLIGSAATMARASSFSSQSARHCLISPRHFRSVFSVSSGNRARRVSAASPCRLTSMG